MVTVNTFWANIFVGLKNVETGVIHSLDEARELCSNYVNSVDLCVTFTSTEYIYSTSPSSSSMKEPESVVGLLGEGYTAEPGFVVGLINYPRLSAEPKKIREQALGLARILKRSMEQQRVTIMFPDETVMLGEVDGFSS